jgi:DNA-binding transcriptional LysR family regulator
MEQLELAAIRVFLHVVQSGSFSGAARRLAMPKSTVSRKVSELEAHVGARLLQRTTRKLGLTDIGRIFYEHAVRIAAEVDEAAQAVGRMQAAPRGLLRVTAPLSFGMLGPIVADYLLQHAEVQVELLCTDRRVDLVDERFDIAIRAGKLADSSLTARAIGTIKRVLVAAPAYCKRRGMPRTPAELEQHTCLVFGAGVAPNVWTLESGGKRVDVRVVPRLTLNDPEVLRGVALAGAGVALMPEFVCADDIKHKRLRRVLSDWCSEEAPVHALYPTARLLSPKAAAFIELMRKRFRTAAP